jgi:integrase
MANRPHVGAKPVPRHTDLSIKALQVPETGSRTYWDDGLGVRVTKNGVKTFITLVASGRRQAIGQFPTIPLKEARRIAQTLRAEKVLGRHYKASEGISEALETFFSTHLVQLRPSTQRELKRILQKHFTLTGKLEDVTARQIHKILDGLQHTPSQALHTFRAFRQFFNWCLSREMLDKSPMANMKPPAKELSRDRVLSDEELKLIWQHSDYYPFGRRGEIGELKWTDVNADTIMLTMTKNSRPHTFPIGKMAQELIAKLPRLNKMYLFPNRDSSSYFKGYSSSKVHFDTLCPVINWTLHDLRRTYATGMQQLKVPVQVTEKLLNHVSGSLSGITGIYQRHEYKEEMREAVDKWEAQLQALIQ